jgi:DNA-binding CsgD family transcriptional regulator
MQQSIFIYIQNGNPIHDFSMCIDITGYKKDNDMTLTIFKLDEENIYHKVFDYAINEKWLDEQYQISEREVEVLSLIANGNSTKQIASQLNLSVHTVNAHRKNILKKTKCKTVAEAVKKIMI